MRGERTLHAIGHASLKCSGDDRPPTMCEQLHSWGIAIDKSRELATHNSNAHLGSQSIFLQLLAAGLIYRSHDHWRLAIRQYAPSLLDPLDELPWSHDCRQTQRHHIGRVEGAEVTFSCEDLDLELPVFTTRPEALFGATFFALSAEHPHLARLVEGTNGESNVRTYLSSREHSDSKPDSSAPPTGVPLGRFVTNPLNGDRLPVYLASYVLDDYATGAVVGVPAHDPDDRAFAQAFDLPVRSVFAAAENSASSPDEILIDTGSHWDGMPTGDARPLILAALQAQGSASPAVHYRLADWRISDGADGATPVPVVLCAQCGPVPLAQDQLPVHAHQVDHPATACPRCAGPALRDTATIDPSFQAALYPFHYAHEDRFPRIDRYMASNEEGVDLLHRRALAKALFAIGLAPADEPYEFVSTLGRITPGHSGPSNDPANRTSLECAPYLERYGADTVRCFLLFMGPSQHDLIWTESRLDALQKFHARLWTLAGRVTPGTSAPGADTSAADRSLLRKTHETIRGVTHHLDHDLQLHTALTAVMGLVTESIRVRDCVSQDTLQFAISTACTLLFPFAPHVSAECYQRLTGERAWDRPWPQADAAYLRREELEIVVQVDGKLQARFQASCNATPEQLKALALDCGHVRERISGRAIQREVVVPGRLVNFVTS